MPLLNPVLGLLPGLLAGDDPNERNEMMKVLKGYQGTAALGGLIKALGNPMAAAGDAAGEAASQGASNAASAASSKAINSSLGNEFMKIFKKNAAIDNMFQQGPTNALNAGMGAFKGTSPAGFAGDLADLR